MSDGEEIHQEPHDPSTKRMELSYLPPIRLVDGSSSDVGY